MQKRFALLNANLLKKCHPERSVSGVKNPYPLSMNRRFVTQRDIKRALGLAQPNDIFFFYVTWFHQNLNLGYLDIALNHTSLKNPNIEAGR